MIEISTDIVEKAVYNLCLKANTCLNSEIYEKIYNAYKNAKNNEIKDIIKSILQNAEISYNTKRPLCQDTGQVIIFIEIGQDILLKGEFIENSINRAVEKCYKENFFRKSVVKNAVFNRINTNTNTPAIINTKIVSGNEVLIKVLIKGAGSENKSQTAMLLPTIDEKELILQIGEMILSAGVNACPPMFVGIGIGGTLEKSALLSKEVFFKNNFTKEEKDFAEKIRQYVNNKAPELYKGSYVLDIKLASFSTHIACMPVTVTINCHSDRFSSCIIKDDRIIYNHKIPDFKHFEDENNDLKEVSTADTEQIKKLKKGERILLTGEIYVARDMAHKKLFELIKEKKELPFDIKDKIIFYAGPCPAKSGEVIGSIGPTTASRMDKYAVKLYDMGLLATIGKGNRNKEVEEVIKKNNAKYFTVTGGIAALLAEKVKKSEIIAFEDFGTEALYKLYVEKFPIKVEIE